MKILNKTINRILNIIEIHSKRINQLEELIKKLVKNQETIAEQLYNLKKPEEVKK